ncbi:AraC family transcriptional regulator [Vibrio ichthyoenteri ATCC 700023]|uniref:AraC family transcriptional regulator n=1 Tax=Vibrio ichthyoenteri ATCC 700023 TaxID=870968 RepID=F9RYN1_9VIBR|nr:AraC family transcriptional regulator [Vibrio ichthyoenteri]EGU46448.1 AraC family transcriptional regulator [Vibrio ichthyoenteri ATCC 700023]
MKPTIENVLNNNQFSWQFKEYHCKKKTEQFSCPWHYHSEYELVLYRDPNHVFQGTCFAGDSVTTIQRNSLFLFGPGLPHMVSGMINDDKGQGHYSMILWFSHQWLESLVASMPELKFIKKFLQRAAYGLQFSPDTAEKIFQSLNNLDSYEPHHQLLRVLQSLSLLADDANSDKLSVNAYGLHMNNSDDESSKRVEAARRFIERNYAAPIKIKDLCQSLHISESSAYRLFERHFLESFSDHLKRFRVGKACEMLLNSELSIALIAEQSGFNNLSNFNRQFKTVKNMTPSDFKAQYN